VPPSPCGGIAAPLLGRWLAGASTVCLLPPPMACLPTGRRVP